MQHTAINVLIIVMQIATASSPVLKVIAWHAKDVWVIMAAQPKVCAAISVLCIHNVTILKNCLIGIRNVSWTYITLG